MQRFKNILFVADQPGSSSATFERALELAQANQARLTVMDVLEPAVWSAENQARFGTDLSTLLQERRRDELSTLTDPHEGELPIRTEVALGTPFLEVIRAVLREDIDLVIKSVETARGFPQASFGPNDQHLIRKCPCPVWIDRADRPRPYRRILAAVDPLSAAGTALDRLILDLATSFVHWEGAEVHVAHAWWLPGEAHLQGDHIRLPSLRLPELLEAQRAAHAEALLALLQDYGLDLDSPRVHFAKDAPAALIARTAAQLPADLIVIGTVGRTGIPGFFIGNTAESVLQVTRAPVLTVKPAGFCTPVAG